LLAKPRNARLQAANAAEMSSFPKVGYYKALIGRYRRFGTTYRSHLQVFFSPRRRWTEKHLNHRLVTSQNSKYLKTPQVNLYWYHRYYTQFS